MIPIQHILAADAVTVELPRVLDLPPRRVYLTKLRRSPKPSYHPLRGDHSTNVYVPFRIEEVTTLTFLPTPNE